MNRFEMLLRVLDGIRQECGDRYNRLYASESKDMEVIWQARSRAYIHLYLKVMFGIRDFASREQLVTDGSYDGGIDGYFIDTEAKKIILLQSKLRRSAEGFESTGISTEELLSMQIRRVLGGEELDLCGQPYNGKIKGLQRKLTEIVDLGRYKVQVAILANINSSYSERDIQILTDGHKAEVYDFSRSYKELLLPVLSGNLFKAKDINISLDLSNKGAGAKISYNTTVPGFDCDITVAFVPIYEIAKFMSDYRNSILKFNPRSYLEIEGDGVNQAIRQTVKKSNGNDFALLNNGITVVCDESSINEQSGRKHRAQLYLRNPQIINGGQTAFTLSRIYDETPSELREAMLAGQEVLVKAIALTPNDRLEVDDKLPREGQRRYLIERISGATNSQTAVSFADRVSGDDSRLAVQAVVYERFGLLVELKKGEYAEGIRAGYIMPSAIIERTLFQRLCLISNNDFKKSLRKRVSREPFPNGLLSDSTKLNKLFIATCLWSKFAGSKGMKHGQNYTMLLPMVFAGICAAHVDPKDLEASAKSAGYIVEKTWAKFEDYLQQQLVGSKIADVPKNETFKFVARRSRKALLRCTEANIEQFFARDWSTVDLDAIDIEGSSQLPVTEVNADL